MKKALFILAVMLLCATTSFAEAKFSMTGNYWAEGKYWFNYNAGPGTDADYSDSSFGFYEQDINLFPKITVDNTSLNFKVSITDTSWGAYDGSEKITQTVDDANSDDNNMQIERAFLTHKFNDMFTLDVGLMDGTQWGTTFGDDKQPQWRVKGTATTKAGVFLAVLEKNADVGKVTYDADGERSDVDSYGLGWVGKVGNVYIKQLLWYADAMNGDTGFTAFNPVLTLNGDMGAFSFETEFNFKFYDQKIDGVYDESSMAYGIYLNFWKALDNMTPGIILAYGSYDKDAARKAGDLRAAGNLLIDAANNDELPLDDATRAAYLAQGTAAVAAGNRFEYQDGFDFEDDFDSSIILGDEYCWGANAYGGDDLRGMTLVKLYVNDIKTGIAPLTMFGYFNYVMSNQKDTAYEDATAWEACLGTNYAITSNLNYSVYGAFADISYDVDGIDDPDSVYMIANSISFSF